MTVKSSPVAHIVFWKLNGHSAEAKKMQANQIIEAFLSLKNQIDGLLLLTAGQNFIDHPDAWDVSVYMEFESFAFLSQYQRHPLHLDIKQLIGPMRLERAQVDFEIGTNQ